MNMVLTATSDCEVFPSVKIIDVGMIKDRHKMPVHDYIINQKLERSILSVKGWKKLVALIEEDVSVFRLKYPNLKKINLFLTGISRVQHTLIAILLKYYKEIDVFDYSLTDNKYFMICKYSKTRLKGLSLNVSKEPIYRSYNEI